MNVKNKPHHWLKFTFNPELFFILSGKYKELRITSSFFYSLLHLSLVLECFWIFYQGVMCYPCESIFPLLESSDKLSRWTTRLIECNHSFCLFFCGERLCAPFTIIVWCLISNCEANCIDWTRCVLHDVNLDVNVCLCVSSRDVYDVHLD